METLDKRPRPSTYVVDGAASSLAAATSAATAACVASCS